MMHYRKGENVEKEIKKEDLPFKDVLPKFDMGFLWMHVKGGTKVSNVIDFAKTALDKQEYRSVIWSGHGGGVVKTISCAEILKRSYPLYQVTRMCYTTVEEHWLPQMEGLEEIVANRQLPAIHILLSLDPIDDSVSGLQKPNTTTDFWVFKEELQRKNNGPRQQRGPRPEINKRGRGKPQDARQQKQQQQQQAGPTATDEQDQRQNKQLNSKRKRTKKPHTAAQQGREQQQQQPTYPPQQQNNNSSN